MYNSERLVRIALSRPCPAGQTDNRQRFFEKRGQNPDSGQNRDGQNPGQEHDTDSSVGQRLGFRLSSNFCYGAHEPIQLVSRAKKREYNIGEDHFGVHF